MSDHFRRAENMVQDAEALLAEIDRRALDL